MGFFWTAAVLFSSKTGFFSTVVFFQSKTGFFQSKTGFFSTAVNSSLSTAPGFFQYRTCFVRITRWLTLCNLVCQAEDALAGKEYPDALCPNTQTHQVRHGHRNRHRHRHRHNHKHRHRPRLRHTSRHRYKNTQTATYFNCACIWNAVLGKCPFLLHIHSRFAYGLFQIAIEGRSQMQCHTRDTPKSYRKVKEGLTYVHLQGAWNTAPMYSTLPFLFDFLHFSSRLPLSKGQYTSAGHDSLSYSQNDITWTRGISVFQHTKRGQHMLTKIGRRWILHRSYI